MTDERPVHIYILLEDWSDEARYVGQTIRPKRRSWEHLRDIPLERDESSLKRAWINDARGRGSTIRMKIIETCTREKANEREAYWIEYYRVAGHRLTNGTETGRPGVRLAPAMAPLTPEKILTLWVEGWDGYRATVDDSMVLARPHYAKIETVRDYLADKPALTQELDAALLALPGEYPALKPLTDAEWLERAAQFNADEYPDPKPLTDAEWLERAAQFDAEEALVW